MPVVAMLMTQHEHSQAVLQAKIAYLNRIKTQVFVTFTTWALTFHLQREVKPSEITLECLWKFFI